MALNESLVIISELLIITVAMGLDGSEATAAEKLLTIYNPGNSPAEYMGTVIGPGELSVVRYDLNWSAKPPIEVLRRIELIDLEMAETGELVVTGPRPAISMSLVLRSSLPVPTPITISATDDEYVWLRFGKPPSGLVELGPAKVYTWIISVNGSATWQLSISPVRFNDFGAARLRPVTVSAVIDVDSLIDLYRLELARLRDMKTQLTMLSRAVNKFTKLVAQLHGNATLLAEALKLSADALSDAYTALNASINIVLALNHQLAALAQTMKIIAASTKSIESFTQYQYAQIVLAAESLDAQARAAETYAENAERLSRTLLLVSGDLRRGAQQLAQLSAMLRVLSENLGELEKALRQVPANATGNITIAQVVELIETTRFRLRELASLAASTSRTLRELSDSTNSLSLQLKQSSASLRSLAHELTRVAESLRSGAKDLLANSTEALIRLAEHALNASAMLESAADDASRMMGSVRSVATRLLNASRILKLASGEILNISNSARAGLAVLGDVKSVIESVEAELEARVAEAEEALSKLESLKNLYDSGKISIRYIIDLPIVLAPINETLNILDSLNVEEGRGRLNDEAGQWLNHVHVVPAMAVAISLAALAMLSFIKKRVGNRQMPPESA